MKPVLYALLFVLPIVAQSADKAEKPVDPKDAKIAALQAQLTASQAAAELWQARANAQATACFDVTVARALVKAVDAESSAQAAQQAIAPEKPKETAKK